MVNLSPVAIMIKSARPTYVYGQRAAIDVNSGASMLLRVGLPAAVSADAVISSATLVLTQTGASSGSIPVSLRRLSAAFGVSRTTWNNVASSTGSTTTVTKSSPGSGTTWSFDVTSDLQGYAAGSLSNFGWRLTSTSSGGTRFKGSAAAVGQPVLILDFVEPGDAPEDLYPNGGVVSLAKPSLSFLVAPDTTAVQVQVDADATGTVDFDSGEIVTDVGSLDLSTTAYVGLSTGASTFWRARSRGATGLTAWSAWASFTRTAKPTVTITSPGSTSDDISPPILWSVSGGTQESWRVIVTRSDGRVLADSGRVTSTATTWEAPTLLRTEGTSATIEVRVWDNVDRTVTPGDPEYATATQTYTLSTAGGVTAPDTITATSDGFTPAVVITATAASAPDGWVLLRDGERIYQNASLPVGTFTFTDYTATPNHAHVYRARRYVAGTGSSSGGPTATVTPQFSGIWLIDPDDLTTAVIWGIDSGSWSSTDLAVTHQPIAGPPIRRVAYRPPLSGTITGDLVDVRTVTADQSIAALYDFKSSEADRVLRLVLGDRNIPVNVGDITISPDVVSGQERWSNVSFAWWQVDEVPWTP